MAVSIDPAKTQDPKARLQNLESLVKLATPQTIPVLLAFLKDSEPAIRKIAVTALGKPGNEQAIEKLVPLLMDGDDQVRECVEAALKNINPSWEKTEGASRAIPALETLAKSEDFWNAMAATELLKRFPVREANSNPQTENAAKILVSLLKDSDADLRLMAAEALGRLGQPSPISFLANVLNDNDEWVRWHAAQSLQALDWQPTDEKQKATFLVVGRKWNDAVQMGAAAVEPLIQSLKSSESRIRQSAASALGKLKDARAEAPLADCLHDQYKAVRQAAAKSLAALGAKSLNAEQRKLLAAEFTV